MIWCFPYNIYWGRCIVMTVARDTYESSSPRWYVSAGRVCGLLQLYSLNHSVFVSSDCVHSVTLITLCVSLAVKRLSRTIVQEQQGGQKPLWHFLSCPFRYDFSYLSWYQPCSQFLPLGFEWPYLSIGRRTRTNKQTNATGQYLST